MANAQNQTDEQAKAAADEKAKQEAEAQAAAEAKEKQEAEIAAQIDAIVAAKVAEALAKQAAQNTTVAAVPGGVAEPVTTSSDETVEGGRYLVNGKFVDCNGKPIKGAKAEDGE